jgi:hypothetical protein
LPIATIEQFSGNEIDEWALHFSKYPFTLDLLDFIGAHICQIIAATMGGKKHRLEKFLLLKRQARSADSVEKAMKAALG